MKYPVIIRFENTTRDTRTVWFIRYLLESGADVAAVNYDGELPVDIAESDAMENLLQKAIDEKGRFNLSLYTIVTTSC